MVAMDVQLDERSTRLLTEEAKRFPREVRRAFYYSCGIVLRMMRGRMSGKNKHIAAWDDFTKRYRAKATWDSAHTFGGNLMWPDKKKLTMQPEGDRVRIGWIGSLEEAAIRFQNGGSEETSKEWRHFRYKEGFKHGEVPRIAVTPSRPVVAQAMADAEKNLANWTLGAFAKVMEGKIKAWDMRYQENPGTQAGARAASRARGGETILEKINRLKAELGITD
jgi:hypothetical protein